MTYETQVDSMEKGFYQRLQSGNCKLETVIDIRLVFGLDSGLKF